MELESSTAALRTFCQHYVDPEHQEAFHALVDDFYQYNCADDKTNAYLKNLSYLFDMIQKMDSDSTDIWEKLEAEYLSHPASGIHNHGT